MRQKMRYPISPSPNEQRRIVARLAGHKRRHERIATALLAGMLANPNADVGHGANLPDRAWRMAGELVKRADEEYRG